MQLMPSGLYCLLYFWLLWSMRGMRDMVMSQVVWLQRDAKSIMVSDSSLQGCVFSDFYVPVFIGNENQEDGTANMFRLLFDTGSSTLAVASSHCCEVNPSYTIHTASLGDVSGSYADGSEWSGMAV